MCLMYFTMVFCYVGSLCCSKEAEVARDATDSQDPTVPQVFCFCYEVVMIIFVHI